MLSDELIEHPCSVISIANGGLMPRCLLPKRFDRSNGLVGFGVTDDIVNTNVGTVPGKKLRNASSDAAARTRNKCLFTFEKFCSHGAFDPFQKP